METAPKPAPIDITLLTEEQRNLLVLQVRAEIARKYAALVLSGLDKFILQWGQTLFPEKFPLPFCGEMHEYFCEIRKEPFTNTEAPRGHAKSTIKCFLIPIYQALEEPLLYRHYLNVQATEDKALSINTSIMAEIETNALIKELYGDQVTKKRWTGQQFVLRNGVIFSAAGAGQSIRGINYQQTRPDYIIVDDLYDEDDINNVDSTKKKNSWFWGTLYPARAKGRSACIHLQGTAINTEDLMESLKKSRRAISRTFRAIKDFDLRIVLWPELNTYDSLQSDREDMGSLIFFREYQNDRLDDSTSKIKRSWLKEWEMNPEDLHFDRHRLLTSVVMGNDPSIGKKVENDPSSFFVVLKYRDADSAKVKFFIDYADQAQLSLDERIKKLLNINQQYVGMRRIRQVRIEAISGFQDYVAEVKRRTNLPVKEITWVKDKISVLETKSKYFEFGQVFLNKRLPQNIKDALVHQLTTNHPKNDDLRDGLFLCLDETRSWRDWV